MQQSSEDKNRPTTPSYRIGVIKFFDTNKGFGYIASNKCEIKTPTYEDFYVNDFSFSEETAKRERAIVVFQYKYEHDGKGRAINVRRYAKSEKDIKLAVSYYGNHEIVALKETKINMFQKLEVPRQMIFPIVESLIKNETERNPETTKKHIQFFVDHYKTEISSGERYIFDRDYLHEEKTFWERLINILTQSEQVALLNIYPTLCRYISDAVTLQEWIDNETIDVTITSTLKDLKFAIDYLPDNLSNKAQAIIDNAVDKEVKKIFEAAIKYGDAAEMSLKRQLLPYSSLSSKKFDKEILHCRKIIQYNKFKENLDRYIANPDANYCMDNLFSSFSAMGDVKASYLEELLSSLQPIIKKFSENKKFVKAFFLINEISKYDSNFASSRKDALFLPVKRYLKNLASSNLNNTYGFESNFLSEYNTINDFFSLQESEELKEECRTIVVQSESIEVLITSTENIPQIISQNEVQHRIKLIIERWTFDNIREFIYNDSHALNSDIWLAEIIVSQALSIIQSKRLDVPFDEDADDVTINDWCDKPKNKNFIFLSHLSKYIISAPTRQLWVSYLQTLCYDDLILLYHNGIIDTLNEHVVCYITNSLTLEDTYSKSEHWYHKPTIKTESIRKIFSNPNIEIFTHIANRLKSMDISNESIALVVWLTELLAENKPNDSDYHTINAWNLNFQEKLIALKNSLMSNSHYSAILWAVHMQTTTSKDSLVEVFAWLPPYLQIRVVKKMFQLIADKKLYHTAESLYNYLQGGNGQLCLPVEIIFSYLKLRENTPTATFTNAQMLHLIADRDDHQEWIGIRDFINKCYGRWNADEPKDDNNEWRRDFYNGVISKDESTGMITLLLPNKMIDESSKLQVYNNKYYKIVSQLIPLVFGNENITPLQSSIGLIYKFLEKDLNELLYLARHFNFNNVYISLKTSYSIKETEEDFFCECRLSDKRCNWNSLPFYWCGNKPCFRPMIRFKTSDEWEDYTVLDFLRILNIPVDYANRVGKTTKYGYYIIFSAFLKSFAKFYDHLKCRSCGNLMKPLGISNFTSRVVNEFSCICESCAELGKTVYLNHCFNKVKCNAIIDSRDSAKCPNGQYICPKCGGCCSTENYRLRLSHLKETGGNISPWLMNFVSSNLGHWEKKEFFCQKCGKPMDYDFDTYRCKNCDVTYNNQN